MRPARFRRWNIFLCQARPPRLRASGVNLLTLEGELISPYNLHTIFTQFPHLTFPSYNSSFLLDTAGFPGRRLTGTGSVIYRGQAFGLFGIQEQRKPTPLILKEAALGSAFRFGWCRSRRIAAPAVNRRLSREPAPGQPRVPGAEPSVRLNSHQAG